MKPWPCSNSSASHKLSRWINFFGVSSWYKYRNTITRRNEWRCKSTTKKWVLQIFECAFLRRRRMAHNGAFFWRCFSEFFRKWSSSAVFPHAVSQVRGQLPHKSGDNPLPCAIFVVPLHSKSDASHVHRTFIALPSHTYTCSRYEPCGRSRGRNGGYRTEIISPTNKQYKGRKRALRAFQVVSRGFRALTRVPGIFWKIQKPYLSWRDSGAAFGVIAKIKLIRFCTFEDYRAWKMWFFRVLSPKYLVEWKKSSTFAVEIAKFNFMR